MRTALTLFFALLCSIAVAHTDGIYNRAANSVGDTQGIDSAVSSVVASAACTLRTVPLTDTDGTTAQTQAVNIGTASADRFVIVGVGSQNTPTISSVTVNLVPLTQDVILTSSGVAAIYSGLVITGSGSQSVVVNWVGASFFNRYLWVETCTGLALNAKRQTTTYATAGGAGSGSISVTSGDFMFLSQYISGGAGAVSYGSSTVAPNNTNAVNTGFVAGQFGVEADWQILSTNAAFSVTTTGTSNAGPAAVVTYR